MKELSLEFLGKKVSCNVEENQNQLRLSVFPRSEDHRRTCSSRSFFRNNIAFSEPRKTSVVNLYRIFEEKVQIYTFLIEFFTEYEAFNFLQFF